MEQSIQKLGRKKQEHNGMAMSSNCILFVMIRGEIMSFSISKGNVDDRIPVHDISKGLHGSLVGIEAILTLNYLKALWKRD